MNTKFRHQEIYATAVKILEMSGGVEAIDSLEQSDRVIVLRRMASGVADMTNCHIDTAKRNVAKTLRRARYGIMQDRWGGPGRNQGRLPMPDNQKRQPVSTRLAPGSKELAQAIAEALELSGWGHTLDLALVRMVEGDRELKVKLVEMGIIVKMSNFDRVRGKE